MCNNLHFGGSLEFDPEIERTSDKFKNQRASEESTSTSTMVGGEEVQRRTL